MLFTAASYAKMSVHYPVAGSSYTYVRKALDSRLGFLVGWTILLDYLQYLALRVIRGMVVHADRMLLNLEATSGALFSQRALLALVAGGMERDAAYRIVQASAQDYTIPTNPQRVTMTFSLPFGPMGVLISGAPVYNPYEGDGRTVAMNANFTLTDQQGQKVAFMDTCNGHPSPHPAGQYHYHGLPTCVTSQVDQQGGPSHIIGYAFDGFPVYGDRDSKGAPIDPAALDDCNGIDSPTPEFPGGIYHYVLLDVPTAQSTIRCLHGRLSVPLPTL